MPGFETRFGHSFLQNTFRPNPKPWPKPNPNPGHGPIPAQAIDWSDLVSASGTYAVNTCLPAGFQLGLDQGLVPKLTLTLTLTLFLTLDQGVSTEAPCRPARHASSHVNNPRPRLRSHSGRAPQYTVCLNTKSLGTVEARPSLRSGLPLSAAYTEGGVW